MLPSGLLLKHVSELSTHDELEDSAQIFILQGSLLYSQIDTELRDGQLAPCIPHGESFRYDINFNYCIIRLNKSKFECLAPYLPCDVRLALT